MEKDKRTRSTTGEWTIMEKPVEDDKWQIEHNANVLKEAEEIKSDPKKMKAIKAYLKEDKKRIKCIEDIVQARQDMYAESDEDGERK